MGAFLDKMRTAKAQRVAVEVKAENERKKALPQYGGTRLTPSLMAGTPFVTSGPVGKDSAGYSHANALGYLMGMRSADQAKEELETSRRLKSMYAHWSTGHRDRIMIPTCTDALLAGVHEGDDDNRKFVMELREKQAASLPKSIDQDEFNAIRRRQKALSTLNTADGGAMVAPPSLGEIIPLQRNAEVFSAAGATQITLPPNGQITFPRAKGTTPVKGTGELQTIGTAQPEFGDLALYAKKYAVITEFSDESMKFTNASMEAYVRNDIGLESARVLDADMLEGPGGVRMKGLLTYAIQNHIAEVGVNGDTLQPEHAVLMDGRLPDAVTGGTAWVMRRYMLASLLARRNDAVSAGDKKGAFTLRAFRDGMEGTIPTLQGAKVIRSNTVSNTRSKGASNDLTYVLYGYFPDWVIGRLGVMEFKLDDLTKMEQGLVRLRGMQFVDAGPRQLNSFIKCDQLVIQ